MLTYDGNLLGTCDGAYEATFEGRETTVFTLQTTFFSLSSLSPNELLTSPPPHARERIIVAGPTLYQTQTLIIGGIEIPPTTLLLTPSL
jgi:hypothetical protein